MPIRLDSVFREINTAPLYYISTHGFYDMDKYIKGEADLITLVPENAIVIETSKIMQYCFFISFLTTLKRLLIDRSKFVEYLGGMYTDEPMVQKIILTALSSCQFYLPGSYIPNRILEATGGVYRPSAEKMESERVGDYGHMGFYKYTPGNNEPEKIFTKRYSELVSRAYGNVTGRGAHVNTSSIPFETFETMFRRIDEFGDSFKIIFFSSCGELRDTNPSRLDMIQEIRRIQDKSVIDWNRRLKVNYDEDRRALQHISVTQKIATEFGLKPENTIPKRPGNYSQGQIPELGVTLRSASGASGASKEGGRSTRRFVKKSKNNRKNKIHRIRKTRKIR